MGSLRAIAPPWLVLALVGFLSSGCIEASRLSAIEQGDKERDERLQALEQSSSAVSNTRKTANDQDERRTARMAELLERTVARLDTLANDRVEQSRQLDALKEQLRGPKAAGPRSETTAECRWLGKRAMLVLLRDDIIATEGFTRLYTSMGCPMEHLGQAFGCAVPAAQSTAAPNMEAQVESCWRELKPPRP